MITQSDVRMLGPVASKKMLDEGWKPTAQEAKEIGTKDENNLSLNIIIV